MLLLSSLPRFFGDDDARIIDEQINGLLAIQQELDQLVY